MIDGQQPRKNLELPKSKSNNAEDHPQAPWLIDNTGRTMQTMQAKQYNTGQGRHNIKDKASQTILHRAGQTQH